MLLVDNVDGSIQPDGILHCRRDAGGAQVGIIPATCKVCARPLHKIGFRASQRDGVMLVDCDGCTVAGVPGHVWQFTAPETAPVRIELDDEPYLRGKHAIS